MGKDGKGAASAEAGVVQSVLATLGALAQQAGIKFSGYVTEVMPLVIEAIQVGLLNVYMLSSVSTLADHSQLFCILNLYIHVV